MKKFLCLVLALSLLFAFASCGDTNEESTTAAENSSENSSETEETSYQSPTADALLSDGTFSTGMKEEFDQMEYAAYVDIFYNKNGDSYEGKTYKKTGTFASIYDAYSSITRYYVWGYADNTKCCDYQWEVVMPEGIEIPESGSYVKMEGTLTKSDKALDGYYFTDITLEVKEEFKNAGFDMDMTTLSPTLVRVQIINMLQHKDVFKDKTIRLFGRALSSNTIQHPYYNENWNMHFSETDKTVATGKYIVIEGTYNKGGSSNVITTSKLTVVD